MKPSKINSKRRIIFGVLTFIFPILKKNTIIKKNNENYNNNLYTPTQITKINNLYFIVDCWHHRIIYSKNINSPINEWSILDNNLAGPHSIASNGNLYVTEDTGRHCIKVYKKQTLENFKLVQTIEKIGLRPHKTVYDKIHKQFFIIGSLDQSIYIFKELNGKLIFVFKNNIKELNGQYCRSITIKNQFLYIIGVNNIIIYQIFNNYIIPSEMDLILNENYRGSNDLFLIENNSGILTCTPKKAIFFKNLNQLVNGQAEDISYLFKGTPYYVEYFDKKYWIPEITEYSRIGCMDALNNRNITTIHDFGAPNQSSLARKTQLPL